MQMMASSLAIGLAQLGHLAAVSRCSRPYISPSGVASGAPAGAVLGASSSLGTTKGAAHKGHLIFLPTSPALPLKRFLHVGQAMMVMLSAMTEFLDDRRGPVPPIATTACKIIAGPTPPQVSISRRAAGEKGDR